MAAAGVIGIARVVMHTKEHLAALIPSGAALVLNTIRWASEIRAADELKLPAQGNGGGRTEAGRPEDGVTARSVLQCRNW